MSLPRLGAIALIFVPIAGKGLLAQTLGPQNNPPIYIGFLDDARKEMVNWKQGVAPDRVVRPAFQKTSRGWAEIAPSSFPAHVSWTVGFDGKNMGKLESKSVAKHDGLAPPDDLTFVQVISTPSSSVPSVGVPQEKYAPLGMEPTKGRRPLVLISEPYTADPDGWKRIGQAPDEVQSSVRAAFRKQFPHVPRCKNENVVQRNWNFPDSALRITSSYASNNGTYLVEVDLQAGDCGYVDDPDDPLASPWFFVTAQGQARRIGAFMSLLDAGDYDNSGRSDVIFMIEQPEDTEGFVLFDADLRKRVSLLWTYH